jgi:hypothetical protein
MIMLLLLVGCVTSDGWYDRGYEDACDDIQDEAFAEGAQDGKTCEWGYVELASTCSQEEANNRSYAWYFAGYEAGCFTCAAEYYGYGYDLICDRGN